MDYFLHKFPFQNLNVLSAEYYFFQKAVEIMNYL